MMSTTGALMTYFKTTADPALFTQHTCLDCATLISERHANVVTSLGQWCITTVWALRSTSAGFWLTSSFSLDASRPTHKGSKLGVSKVII